MNHPLDDLNARCGWECVVKSYDGWRLILSSGTSAEYAKPFAEFTGVSYVSLPFEFSHPKFRAATFSEQEQVAKAVPLDSGDQLFVVEAETMASLDRHLFFIAATGVEVTRKTAPQSE